MSPRSPPDRSATSSDALVNASQWRAARASASLCRCRGSVRRRAVGRLSTAGVVFGDPATWGEATAVTVTNTDRYGAATAQACPTPG